MAGKVTLTEVHNGIADFEMLAKINALMDMEESLSDYFEKMNK
jgi:hypothetical protein